MAAFQQYLKPIYDEAGVVGLGRWSDAFNATYDATDHWRYTTGQSATAYTMPNGSRVSVPYTTTYSFGSRFVSWWLRNNSGYNTSCVTCATSCAANAQPVTCSPTGALSSNTALSGNDLFPAAYHPLYPTWLSQVIASDGAMAAWKDDPYLFGHFIDNELPQVNRKG
jgi:hypothetical protein